MCKAALYNNGTSSLYPNMHERSCVVRGGREGRTTYPPLTDKIPFLLTKNVQEFLQHVHVKAETKRPACWHAGYVPIEYSYP